MNSSSSSRPRKFLRCTFAAFVFFVTLVCMVPCASAGRMTSTKYAGVVESIDYQTKTVVFQRGSDGKDFQLSWYWDTTFVADGKHVKADALKAGTSVKVEYHEPLFGRRYISRIEWSATPDPSQH